MPGGILIADDHEGIRGRLRSLLEGAGLNVCGEAIDGPDVFAKTNQLAPDLIILDLSMPVMDGFEAIKIIAGSVPRARILVYSVHEGSEVRSQAFEAGAHSYISKSTPASELLAEVNRLLAEGP